MEKIILFSIIIISFSSMVFAQNTNQIILDYDTSEPIPYANICMEGLSSNYKTYTTTKSDGTFLNKFNEPVKITISTIGYKTIIDTLHPGIENIIRIKPDVFNLSQVVVTATRSNKTLADAPVITQVITGQQIESRGLTSVQSVLENDIPGLDFQKVGFGTDISMQGLSTKNILILVDGERLAGENGNNVDYSRLNTNNIERIEIVKGASSALYGSQAMGGVINIITKTTRKKIEFSFGSKYTEITQINFKDLTLLDDSYIYKSNLDKPNFNYNASLGFNFKYISGRTDFSSKSSDAYQLIDLESQTYSVKNIDTVLVFPIAKTNIDGFDDYSVNQNLKITIKKNLTVNVKGSYYNHNQYDFSRDNKYQNFEDLTLGTNVKYNYDDKTEIVASINRDEYSKFDFLEKLNKKRINYKNLFLNPKLTGMSKIFEIHTITIGAEYLKESLLTDKFVVDTLIEKDVNTSVFFVQDDIKFSENIFVIAGGRADYHSAFGLYFSPKISAMYKFTNHTVRFNYAKGFRAPNLKELYMEWDLLGMFVLKGDEKLRPETNDYVSLSMEYSRNNFNGSINIYKNWFNNKIEGKWRENQTVYQYVNISKSQLTGFELLLKYRIFKQLNFSGGYSFVVDERSAEDQMAPISPHSANLRLEYKFSKGFYNTNLIVSGKITGAKNYESYSDIVSQGKYIEARYDVHYSAFSIWNIALSQKIFNSTNLVFGINNILDFKASIINFNTTITPGRQAFISLQIDVDKFFNNKQKQVK